MSDEPIRPSREAAAPQISDSFDPIGALLRGRVLDPPDRPGIVGRLERFDVLELIGSGGMGVILLVQERGTSRRYALKTLKPALARDPYSVRLFLREGRHMQQMSHPSILRVLEISDRLDGPYFIAPFIERGSLAQLLKSGKGLDQGLALSVALQVADGLGYAHAHGVIHRDLKPANVLVDGEGHAYVADFGLVRALYGDSTVDAQKAQRVGTGPYMSPGVAAGQAEDTRCDIYSFGALLYEMLTGQPPYDGATTQEVTEKILSGPPPAIGQLNPSAPPALIRVAEGAMARELRNRYASMEDVAEDLRKVQAGQTPRGPRGEGRSRRTPLAAGAMVLALLVVVGIVMLLRHGAANKAQTMPVSPTASDLQPLATIALVGGNLNGQAVTPASPEVMVDPGSSIVGSVQISVESTYDRGAIVPVAATPSWGNPSTSYWGIASWAHPGNSTYTVPVNLTAPSQNGTYYICVAAGGKYDYAQVMSCTHAAIAAVWGDGNDVANWSATQFEQAIANGWAADSELQPDSSYQTHGCPATAIRVVVQGQNSAVSRSATLPAVEAMKGRELLVSYAFGGAHNQTESGRAKRMGGARVTDSGLVFDGTESHVEIPASPAFELTDSVAISACIKRSEIGRTDPIIGKCGGQPGGTSHFEFGIGLDNKLSFAFFVGHWVKHSSQGAIADTNWHTVAVTYDRKEVRFFIDGSLDSVCPESAPLPANGSSLQIGEKQSSWPFDYFKGTISSLQISDGVVAAEGKSWTPPSPAAGPALRVPAGFRAAARSLAEPYMNTDWAKEIVHTKTGIEMVFIPAGEFVMGSPSTEEGHRPEEGPQRRVRITKPFYMGVTEVTQQQYEAVMGTNPSRFKGPDNPVETVSLGEALELCRRLNAGTEMNVRLPTEAEWEYACRAGSTTRFFFGESASDLGDYGWYDANSGARTHPVGTKKPNAWGLYDMCGNVRQYCADSSDDSRCVLRGGSWKYDWHGGCRSAYRIVPDDARPWPDIGFRVAMDAGQSDVLRR